MKQHYSEADLLETYYTQPGQSMPVMMHLADCPECAARYQRLDRKLRSTADCGSEKHDTFWTRQRISIMRRVATRAERTVSFARIARVAAAAMLLLVIGGVITWNVERLRVSPAAAVATASSTLTATVASAAETSESAASTDPWQSDELKDYQSIVAWESWVETTPRSGEQSL